MNIVQCVSCEGYGWFEDETGTVTDCDWCGGVGYVSRVGDVDTRIPEAEWGAVSAQLEALETARLREMGYTGAAKQPWEQDVREGTRGGENPYERE